MSDAASELVLRRQVRNGLITEMPINELYSKRQKRLRGEVPDVYTYDNIPQELRAQIIYIWNDAFGRRSHSEAKAKIERVFRSISRVLAREYGLPMLSSSTPRSRNDLEELLVTAEEIEKVLDVIELSFKYIEKLSSDVDYQDLVSPSQGVLPPQWYYETIGKKEMKENAVMTHETTPLDPAKVFVVHGRNEKARDALFQFLRSIGLKPIEWSQAIRATGNPAPYVGEILDAAFSLAQAIVVLMTPDDLVYLRQPLRGAKEPPHEIEPTGQARPNVLFEAGMAMGRHPLRTVLVELGELRPFSDVAGRHAVRINNTTQKRQDLAQRLELAGCPINLNDRDWHTAGDFDAALEGL